MIRTVKIVVSGRVQGVFFRKFTKHKADELGVFGTVQNLENGNVEIVAQAENVVLENLIQWCHKGPIMARVDDVKLEELPDNQKLHQAFEII